MESCCGSQVIEKSKAIVGRVCWSKKKKKTSKDWWCSKVKVEKMGKRSVYVQQQQQRKGEKRDGRENERGRRIKGKEVMLTKKKMENKSTTQGLD